MLQPGDRVVAGVSGGADSLCLLFVLLEWAKKAPLSLAVVHVDHGLRQESGEDALYVKELCRRLKLPFYLTRENVKQRAEMEKCSQEEAGRKIRYKAFRRAAEGFGADKIAVAERIVDLQGDADARAPEFFGDLPAVFCDLAVTLQRRIAERGGEPYLMAGIRIFLYDAEPFFDIGLICRVLLRKEDGETLCQHRGSSLSVLHRLRRSFYTVREKNGPLPLRRKGRGLRRLFYYFTLTSVPVKTLQSPAGTFVWMYSRQTPTCSPVKASVTSKPHPQSGSSPIS